MNFLALCKRVRQDSGVTGEGPAAVTSQTGILARIVNWTKRANNEVQLANPSWTFLRKSKSVSFVIGQSDYTPTALTLDPVGSITDIYVEGNKIEVVDYSDWLDDIAKFEDASNQAAPTHVTLDDSGNLKFYPTPSEAFTLSVVYQRKPVQLTANTDTPIFDEAFHEIIVARALMFYADYEEDNYRYQRASLEYEHWLSLMSDRYLPQISLRSRLA